MTLADWIATAVAFAVSVGSPVLVKRLLARGRVIDIPNARSSHETPTLRGAGIAPLLGLASALTIVLIADRWSEDSARILTVLLSSVAIAIAGLIEDIRGIPIAARAGVQLLVGALATAALVALSGSTPWWVLVGAIFFAAYTNAANFMDGVNSISSLHGVLSGVTFAVIGIITSTMWLEVVGLILALCFLAFLPWNVGRRPIFLGDVGSYLLGGSVSIVVIAAIFDGISPLAVLSPLVIYIADSGVTLVRRVLRGERWQDAHRMHVYQRLTDSGLPHVVVGLMVAAFSLCTAVLGILGGCGIGVPPITAAGGILLLAILYLFLPRLFHAPALQQDAVSSIAVPESDLPRPIPANGLITWAVVGGTGFIGQAVVNEMRRENDVIVVSSPRLLLSASPTVEGVIGVLGSCESEIESLAKSFAGVDVIVNAAGLAAPDSAGGEDLFGANALVPIVVLEAARRAGVARFIHLSSAAVQGRKKVLDETSTTEAFSPYSRSKALGEATLLSVLTEAGSAVSPEVVIIRATSVQGAGRSTTRQLQKIARSRIASVARPGNLPTVVSSLRGLVEFIGRVGTYGTSVPTIILQPWEGMTTSLVLESAGGRAPRQLPAALCRGLVRTGFAVGSLVPRVSGVVRRVDLMWFGQAQDARWAKSVGLESSGYVADVLAENGETI